MSKSASKNPLLGQLFKYIYQADLTKITECLNRPNISEFINSYYIEGFDQYLQQKFKKKAQHQNDVEYCRKILLQQKNVTGLTPLSYACVLDKIEVIKIFLSCEAIDINSCNWDNTRAFSITVRNNNITTIKLLLEHNVSTDYIDDYKHTPLTQAIYLLMSNKIYFKIAKLLLDYVDINFCNGDGLSPLCLALNYKNTTGYYCMADRYKYYTKIIKLLEKKGAKNFVDMDRYFNSENDDFEDDQDINYFPADHNSHQQIQDVVNSFINSIGDCKYYDGPIKVLVAFYLNVKSMEEFNQTVCGQSEIYQIDKVTPIDDWANIN